MKYRQGRESGSGGGLAEDVAARVLAAMTPTTTALVSAAELATLLGVRRAWVYANAARLGAVRLGDGPRGRLRFDVAVARAALGAPAVVPEVERAAPRASRPTTANRPPGAILKVRAAEERTDVRSPARSERTGRMRGAREKAE